MTGRAFNSTTEGCLTKEQLEKSIGKSINDTLKADLFKSLPEGSPIVLIHWQKPGSMAIEAADRAELIAERTNQPVVVLFNGSYMTVTPDGECKGPLAEYCNPSHATASDLARYAISTNNTELLKKALAYLPEKKESGGL